MLRGLEHPVRAKVSVKDTGQRLMTCRKGPAAKAMQEEFRDCCT
jgi:hypothetical protein